MPSISEMLSVFFAHEREDMDVRHADGTRVRRTHRSTRIGIMLVAAVMVVVGLLMR